MAGTREFIGQEIHENISSPDTFDLPLSLIIKVLSDSTINVLAIDTAYPHNISWYFYQYEHVLNHVSSNDLLKTITFCDDYGYYDKFTGGYSVYDTIVYDYINDIITEHREGYVRSRHYDIFLHSK